MKPLILASLPAVVLGLSSTQVFNPQGNQWRCGHALESGDDDWLRRTPTAGILLIDPDTGLDYYRRDPKETEWATQNDVARWDATPFKDLFCADYISQYKTPTLSSRQGGVCIRDVTPGKKWDSILEADNEARALFNHFGTQHGYQQSAPKFKDPELDSGSLKWGSGATGSSPANWCEKYMRQMLCHIAFPQFAGTESDLDTSRPHPFGGAPVRPVCSEDCSKMMDNCNRKEPNPKSQIIPELLEAGQQATINPLKFDASDDAEEELSNSYYCDSWNRGIGLAKAGTGVGDGEFDNEEMYCAKWDSSAVVAPVTVLIAAVMAIVLL